MEQKLPGFDRISCDPLRMNGQPCVRGTRLTVRRVLSLLKDYPDRSELFREYPELTSQDVDQVLLFAASRIEDKLSELPAAK